MLASATAQLPSTATGFVRSYRPDLEALAGGRGNVSFAADAATNSVRVTFANALDALRASTFLAPAINGVRLIYTSATPLGGAAPKLTALDGARWIKPLPKVMQNVDRADVIFDDWGNGNLQGWVMTWGGNAGQHIDALINDTWPGGYRMTAGPQGA